MPGAVAPGLVFPFFTFHASSTFTLHASHFTLLAFWQKRGRRTDELAAQAGQGRREACAAAALLVRNLPACLVHQSGLAVHGVLSCQLAGFGTPGDQCRGR